MTKLLIRLGTDFHTFVLLGLWLLLNVTWTLTLSAFGHQFKVVSGYPPIDLQNVSSILTAEAALNQIATYSNEVKMFYWSFFILDNIIPLLSFGSFSLIWVVMLRRLPYRFYQNLLNSPFILIPWGVGLFDILENLCFILCISGYVQTSAVETMNLGLFFVRLKAICLFATFGTTLFLFVSLVFGTLRKIFTPKLSTA